MKKWLKIWLIVWWSLLVAWWARAWLTKAGIIPNWLGIEALCSCVNCNWKIFDEWDFPQKNWKECCEWTYTIQNCNKFGAKCRVADIKKPIIYLYPTRETKIHIELWTQRNLSHTYPKYNPEKWRNVIAQSMEI